MRKRICDLDASLEKNGLDKLVLRLHRELEHQGFSFFKPRAYVGDSWYSPEGSTLISVPFYLCDPQLVQLEKFMTGKPRHKSKEWIMRYLRHETGHCFDHAYGLSRNRAWQKVFGSPRRKYDVDVYDFDPDSTDFVINLGGHYAQSHPEEDFAETFAVVLNPQSQWRTTYRRWPGAYHKLKFVEKLIAELGGEPPLIRGYQRPMGEARYLRRTLAAYYRQKLN